MCLYRDVPAKCHCCSRTDAGAWVCVIALRLFFHDPHCGKAWAVCEGQSLPGLWGRALPAADVLPWRRDHGLLGRKGNSQGEGLPEGTSHISLEFPHLNSPFWLVVSSH